MSDEDAKAALAQIRTNAGNFSQAVSDLTEAGVEAAGKIAGEIRDNITDAAQAVDNLPNPTQKPDTLPSLSERVESSSTMFSSIVESLREAHPDMSEDELNVIADSIKDVEKVAAVFAGANPDSVHAGSNVITVNEWPSDESVQAALAGTDWSKNSFGFTDAQRQRLANFFISQYELSPENRSELGRFCAKYLNALSEVGGSGSVALFTDQLVKNHPLEMHKLLAMAFGEEAVPSVEIGFDTNEEETSPVAVVTPDFLIAARAAALRSDVFGSLLAFIEGDLVDAARFYQEHSAEYQLLIDAGAKSDESSSPVRQLFRYFSEPHADFGSDEYQINGVYAVKLFALLEQKNIDVTEANIDGVFGMLGRFYATFGPAEARKQLDFLNENDRGAQAWDVLLGLAHGEPPTFEAPDWYIQNPELLSPALLQQGVVTDENNNPVENDPGIEVNGVQWGSIEGGKTEQTAIDMLESAPNGEVFYEDGKIEIWWFITGKDGKTKLITAYF